MEKHFTPSWPQPGPPPRFWHTPKVFDALRRSDAIAWLAPTVLSRFLQILLGSWLIVILLLRGPVQYNESATESLAQPQQSLGMSATSTQGLRITDSLPAKPRRVGSFLTSCLQHQGMELSLRLLSANGSKFIGSLFRTKMDRTALMSFGKARLMSFLDPCFYRVSQAGAKLIHPPASLSQPTLVKPLFSISTLRGMFGC